MGLTVHNFYDNYAMRPTIEFFNFCNYMDRIIVSNITVIIYLTKHQENGILREIRVVSKMKTPGKSFREGTTLIKLFQRFPDDVSAERWLEEQRWESAGKPSNCPLCGCTDKLQSTPNRTPLPYWCGTCRKHFSVRTGSVMHRSKIPLHKWVIAIYLWSTSLKGVSSMKLHRDLNITQKSAYFLALRLRHAWYNTPEKMAVTDKVPSASRIRS